jgi:glycosyltransferase involved in cell wall biosynthesis
MNDKPKLLFVIPGMIGGGSERVMTNLMNCFAENGYEVIGVTLWIEVHFDFHPAVKIINLDTRQSRNISKKYLTYLKYARAVRRVVNMELPNAIIAFGSSASLVALLASVGADVRVIQSQRNDFETEYPFGLKRFIGKYIVFRCASGCVFQTKRQMVSFTLSTQRRSVVIPNLSERRFFDIGNSGRHVGIVGVGRLSSPKNWFCAIKAYSLISDKVADNFTIYGSGSLVNNQEEALRDYAVKLGVEDRIIFAGRQENIEKLISGARLFVMSSDTEGIPNSLIEAQIMGLPCVSTDFDGGGAHELIEDGYNGLIVPKGDADALAEAMLRVLMDEGLSARLASNAKLRSERFDPDTVFRQWESYILSVIQKRRR